MEIQRQSETFAYRLADSDRETNHKVNRLLSDGRYLEAVALWEISGIPLEQMHRNSELTRWQSYYSTRPEGNMIPRVMQRIRDYPDSLTSLPREQEVDYNPNAEDDEDDSEEFDLSSLPDINEPGEFGFSSFDDDNQHGVRCEDCGDIYDTTDLYFRHRSLAHPEGSQPYFRRGDPNSTPVVNTADPNTHLKSPWSRKIIPYNKDNPIPKNFRDRWDGGEGLYEDFDFSPDEELFEGSEPPSYFDDPSYDPEDYEIYNNGGIYQINDSRRQMHKPPVGFLQYHIVKNREKPTIKIDLLNTHPKYRLKGVGAALVNALAEDYPDHLIDPGYTTPHGTGFTNYMRQNAPGADQRLDTSQWDASSPNYVSEDQMKAWGVDKKRSPVFARIALHNNRILADSRADSYTGIPEGYEYKFDPEQNIAAMSTK